MIPIESLLASCEAYKILVQDDLEKTRRILYNYKIMKDKSEEERNDLEERIFTLATYEIKIDDFRKEALAFKLLRKKPSLTLAKKFISLETLLKEFRPPKS
jgi:hypothetical protein